MKKMKVFGQDIGFGSLRRIRSVDEATLASADTVSVTYRTQKKGERGVTVTQHRTIAKPGTGLCHVRALAGLVSRVLVCNLV